MLLTSCYSGVWVLQPNLRISALTAASAEKPSWSWPSSLRGRSHGSVHATAVREALIKMKDEKVTQQHPAPSGNYFDKPDHSTTKAGKSLSYALLVLTRRPETARQKSADYSKLVHQAPVFDPPTAQQGWHYNKPNDYWAVSLAESNLTPDQIKEAINNVSQVSAIISQR